MDGDVTDADAVRWLLQNNSLAEASVVAEIDDFCPVVPEECLGLSEDFDRALHLLPVALRRSAGCRMLWKYIGFDGGPGFDLQEIADQECPKISREWVRQHILRFVKNLNHKQHLAAAFGSLCYRRGNLLPLPVPAKKPPLAQRSPKRSMSERKRPEPPVVPPHPEPVAPWPRRPSRVAYPNPLESPLAFKLKPTALERRMWVPAGRLSMPRVAPPVPWALRNVPDFRYGGQRNRRPHGLKAAVEWMRFWVHNDDLLALRVGVEKNDLLDWAHGYAVESAEDYLKVFEAYCAFFGDRCFTRKLADGSVEVFPR